MGGGALSRRLTTQDALPQSTPRRTPQDLLPLLRVEKIGRLLHQSDTGTEVLLRILHPCGSTQIALPHHTPCTIGVDDGAQQGQRVFKRCDAPSEAVNGSELYEDPGQLPKRL